MAHPVTSNNHATLWLPRHIGKSDPFHTDQRRMSVADSIPIRETTKNRHRPCRTLPQREYLRAKNPWEPAVPPYALDKLIAETRRLAAEYRRATGQSLPVSAEIARHDAARILNLELKEQRVKGVDAIGRGERAGMKIQIKGRVIADERKGGQRIGQLNRDGDWDLVVLSLMDADYEPFEIYEATREEILEALDSASSNRARRGAMSVARFKIIGRLVWSRENGLEPELWSNR